VVSQLVTPYQYLQQPVVVNNTWIHLKLKKLQVTLDVILTQCVGYAVPENGLFWFAMFLMKLLNVLKMQPSLTPEVDEYLSFGLVMVLELIVDVSGRAMDGQHRPEDTIILF
jgi:hypothetical protein